MIRLWFRFVRERFNDQLWGRGRGRGRGLMNDVSMVREVPNIATNLGERRCHMLVTAEHQDLMPLLSKVFQDLGGPDRPFRVKVDQNIIKDHG